MPKDEDILQLVSIHSSVDDFYFLNMFLFFIGKRLLFLSTAKPPVYFWSWPWSLVSIVLCQVAAFLELSTSVLSYLKTNNRGTDPVFRLHTHTHTHSQLTPVSQPQQTVTQHQTTSNQSPHDAVHPSLRNPLCWSQRTESDPTVWLNSSHSLLAWPQLTRCHNNLLLAFWNEWGLTRLRISNEPLRNAWVKIKASFASRGFLGNVIFIIN